ncbi:MAG: hypothetical protein J5530_05395 [Clostridia bacterium]|nr:hypothetical protein [Clostridia bacterium]
MDNEVKNAKSEFDAIYEREDARYKVTLLEKHLMESREEFNRLKEEELALRQKQLEIVRQMEDSLEQTRKIDQALSDSIDEKIERIKTDMFGEWQESLKESVLSTVSELTADKLKEYEELYRMQNETIEKQAKKFRAINTSTRVIRILAYTVCFVAFLTLVFLPAALYLVDDIKEFLKEPSVWGGVVLFAAVVLMILALALAILLRRKTPKE